MTFSSVVNKHCDEFKLADLSADDFKCLIFVQGLVSTKDSEIRRRVLSKLESEPNLTLKKLAEDCQRIISVKKDSRDIETGIQSKVEFSQWVAPTVYVKKKSKEIRVCAVLRDYHYPLPSPEEVFTKLKGGKIFSKVDLSDAYLQIPLEENSSKLLCINTHQGLFKFERLPFGIKVAPAIFQEVRDTMLDGLDFAIAYLDDIIMISKSKEQHQEHVRRVFSWIQEFGFKVKEEKCEFFLEEIKYLGHIIDKDDRRPDPDRATAIKKKMPVPGNITELQSFLGLANNYQSFIPNMHNLRAPLNALLKKDSIWKWTPECQEVFNKIKNTLKSDLSLAHYNPESDIIVASDASSHGIGAYILNEMPDGSKKPVVQAPHSLLPSQIEKEALAIIFAVTKFHRYLHWIFFKLQTDHKPPLTLFGSKKGLPVYTANRLLRWGTILLNYNFKLEYLPSRQIGHADGLSRLVPSQSESLEDSVIASLRTDSEMKNMMLNTIRELPVTLQEIKREAQEDEFISATKQVCWQKNNR